MKEKENVTYLLFRTLILSILVFSGCTREDTTGPLPEGAPDLIVSINATGVDIDPNITAVVNDSVRSFISGNGLAEFFDLEAGKHHVTLENLRLNCEIQGKKNQSVTITSGEISRLSFDIFCLDALLDQILFIRQENDKHNLYVMTSTGSGIELLEENVDPESTLSIFADGTLIAYTSLQDGNPEVYVRSVDGTLKRNISNHPGIDRNPSWNPDSTLIAFESDRDGNFEIYRSDLEVTEVLNLTKHPADDLRPVWRPAGSAIAFEREFNTNRDVFLMNGDGTQPFNLSPNPGFDGKPDWSPSGSLIAFVSERTGDFEIFSVQPDGKGLSNMTNHPGFDTNPVWGPFGDRLVFESSRDSDFEIFVMDRNGGGERKLTDNERQDDSPSWSPAGDKVIYSSFANGERSIYVISSEGGAEFNLSNTPGKRDFDPLWGPFQESGESDGSEGDDNF